MTLHDCFPNKSFENAMVVLVVYFFISVWRKTMPCLSTWWLCQHANCRAPTPPTPHPHPHYFKSGMFGAFLQCGNYVHWKIKRNIGVLLFIITISRWLSYNVVTYEADFLKCWHIYIYLIRYKFDFRYNKFNLQCIYNVYIWMRWCRINLNSFNLISGFEFKTDNVIT